MTGPPGWSAESAVIHGGTERRAGRPVVPPPTLASVFVSAGVPGADPGYARNGNPTWTAVEASLGAMEQAEAVVFGSGQAASMALMLALAAGREQILMPRDGYYNTRALAARLRPHGARAVLVDLQNLTEVERELSRGTALLWAETPTNPLLRVADLTALAELAAAAGAPMIVDNTVATGLLQRPLDFGAVASLCSLTKSVAGHSDLIMGAVLTRDADLLADLRGWRTLGGGIAGPMESWLALRSLKTLPLRIERQSSTALRLAGLPVRAPAGDRGALSRHVQADARGSQQADAARLRAAALVRGGRRRGGRGRRHRGGPADRPGDQLRRSGDQLGAARPLAR